MKPTDMPDRPRAAASRALRAGAALATILMLASPAGAQGRSTNPGEYPDRDDHRRHHGFHVPGAAIVPLVALGIGLIAGAASRAEPDPRDDRPQPQRPSRNPVRVRPGAEAQTPRQQTERLSKSRPKLKPKPPASGAGVAGGAAAGAGPAAAAKPDDPSAIVPGEVLFEVRAGVSEGDVARLASRARLEKISSETFELTGSTIYRYRVTDGRPVEAALAALRADPRIRSAQPNHVYDLSQGAPGDIASTQYSVAKMRLKEAHAAATGADVTIAIIDAGVDPSHPALKDAVTDSFDPVGEPFAAHAHGTAVAGLAAARGDLASPAPGARLIAVRAFSGDARPAKPGAEGTTIHILRGLDWAAKRGAKVVNMSFAGPPDAKIAAFIAAGTAKGAIYVAAAGNAGASSPPLYPAADPNVIAVTATDVDDKLLSVANRGRHIAVAAPGVDVVVATPGGGYGYMSGTSMASAEVAGVVALMAQARPGLTLNEARAALAKSAVDLGAPGFDPEFGAGEIDAKGAVDAVSLAPAASAAPPSASATPARQ